jgi:hypothetical protein
VAAILVAAFVSAPTWAAGAASTPAWRIAKIVPTVGQEYWVSASGPANAWATGDLKATPVGSRLGVERWNGRAWQPIAAPARSLRPAVERHETDHRGRAGRPDEVSAVSANDMWVVGTSRATLDQPANRQVTLAMHWNGKTWNSVRVPVPRLPRGGSLDSFIAATGPAGLWFAYVAFDGNANLLSNGLLRWDGRKWHRLALPADVADSLNGAVQDGHGGLWVNAIDQIYHYSAGRWTRQPLPKGISCDALAWIPRTRAAWCSGTLFAAHGPDGVILRSPA